MIDALAAEYAISVDARDYQRLTNVFTEDALIELFLDSDLNEPAATWRGGEEFAASVREAHGDYRRTNHVLGQNILTVQDNVVKGHLYTMAYHIYSDQGRWWNRLVAARYDDEYARRDGGWLLSKRGLHVDWTAFLPMNAEPTAQGWLPVRPA